MSDIKELGRKQREMKRLLNVMLEVVEEAKSIVRLEVRTKADLNRLEVLLKIASECDTEMGAIF